MHTNAHRDIRSRTCTHMYAHTLKLTTHWKGLHGGCYTPTDTQLGAHTHAHSMNSPTTLTWNTFMQGRAHTHTHSSHTCVHA